MKRLWIVMALALLAPALALAHFMVVQPTADIVVDKEKSVVTVDLRFAHPFEQGIMDMAFPKQFGVLVNGKKTDLKPELKKIDHPDGRTYKVSYKLTRPGDHIFYVEPEPYWEPSENKFIIHYTKAIVHAFGLEEGWDELVGFKTEIKPLTRPYGLWTGNVFQGQVLLDGKSVPFAEIEVSHDNKQGVKSPAEVFNIQVVMADANGVFTYGLPHAGWWGFAALSDSDKKLPGPGGEEKDVELGALIWVYAVDMK